MTRKGLRRFLQTIQRERFYTTGKCIQQNLLKSINMGIYWPYESHIERDLEITTELLMNIGRA